MALLVQQQSDVTSRVSFAILADKLRKVWKNWSWKIRIRFAGYKVTGNRWLGGCLQPEGQQIPKKIPVIALTAHAMAGDRKSTLNRS